MLQRSQMTLSNSLRSLGMILYSKPISLLQFRDFGRDMFRPSVHPVHVVPVSVHSDLRSTLRQLSLAEALLYWEQIAVPDEKILELFLVNHQSSNTRN